MNLIRTWKEGSRVLVFEYKQENYHVSDFKVYSDGFAAVTPYFQSKNVWIRNADWTNEYISEMVNSPGSRNDDQVDQTGQAIEYMQRTFGGLQEYSDKNNIAIARYISTGRSRRRY